jgi:hypothetical protein
MMYLFNRTISANVRSANEKTVTVEGLFMDYFHELCMTLVLDLETDLIISADGDFCRIPHSDCGQTLKLISNLVGIDIKGNVRKQVQAAVGLSDGCVHISELALECIKVLIQAKFRLLHLTMPQEEITDIAECFFQGSCFHYKKYKKLDIRPQVPVGD